MNDTSIRQEDVPAEYVGLGGRGLTSIMINSEVAPASDPLGSENKLIIAPGLLSGTPLVNTSRISIGAKSPLTGGIKESNAGGTVADSLARMGITALVIEGKAREGDLYLIRIDKNGSVSFHAADEFKGMGTYAVTAALLERYGERNSVLCIGPAGEQKLLSASVQSSDADGRPCRAAGR